MLKATCLSAFVFFACMATVQAMPTPVNQAVRDVTLDPAVHVHKVDVVGWPNLTTSIKFPDTFDEANVLCGQCIDLSGNTMDGESQDRNWIIEKRVGERAIHLRPANLPGLRNPPSAFATNIYVGLDGGHTINIALRLLQPSPQNLDADAVVTILLPGNATLAGRLAEAKKKLLEDLDEHIADKAASLMLSHLQGRVHCRTIGWRKPFRTDKTVVRLNQLCSSAGKTPAFWVTFEVENRSDVKLDLEQATLDPEGLATVIHGPVESHLDKTTLAFGESTCGIAVCALQAQSSLPSTWRLRIAPVSAEQPPIEVPHLSF